MQRVILGRGRSGRPPGKNPGRYADCSVLPLHLRSLRRPHQTPPRRTPLPERHFRHHGGHSSLHLHLAMVHHHHLGPVSRRGRPHRRHSRQGSRHPRPDSTGPTYYP